MVEGRYEIPLPFREPLLDLPNTKELAQRRIKVLRKKLLKEDDFRKSYYNFMDEMLSKNYAEEVPKDEWSKTENVWYIPHFGVRHSSKPEKVRVVFDCAAKVDNVSLNDLLVPGPDINNLLIDVLMRFREGKFGYSADIETMFYQVRVPANQRDYLRFLWWKDNKLQEEPVPHRMRVHLFGACSSPSIANFALKQIAKDEGSIKNGACETIMRNFYVDDCLKSGDDLVELKENAKNTKRLCAKGGFNLTKFSSSNLEVLEDFPNSYLNPKAIEIVGVNRSLGGQKALGLKWKLDDDTMRIDFDLNIPETKRELLSVLASIYDPLGMVGPLVLGGRLCFQELCKIKLDWNEKITDQMKLMTERWIRNLNYIKDVSMKRSLTPEHFGHIIKRELHFFTDASEKAYCAVAYLRLIDSNSRIHCSFLMGKSRVGPIKVVSIPRLELTASTLAIKLNKSLQNVYEWIPDEILYWTDSTTVLRYISNERARYHTFVANRVAMIREGSSINQWRYVGTDTNPADDGTRGVLTEKWLKGPDFLWKDRKYWPTNILVEDNTKGLGIRAKVMMTGCTRDTPLKKLINYYSEWNKLLRACSWYFIFGQTLTGRNLNFKIDLQILKDMELKIIAFIQRESYLEEISELEKGKQIKTSSKLSKLNPIIKDGVLRVKGRLSFGEFGEDEKTPVILPNKGHVTDLIIINSHRLVGHMGRMSVLNHLREKYWVINGNSAVRRVIGKCIVCRKINGRIQGQKMADLPAVRITEGGPPFLYTGLDFFGPFLVRRGRGQSRIKRYGVIFTCLTMQAVHLEVAADMTTDSFINILRRFIARRGHGKEK